MFTVQHEPNLQIQFRVIFISKGLIKLPVGIFMSFTLCNRSQDSIFSVVVWRGYKLVDPGF